MEKEAVKYEFGAPLVMDISTDQSIATEFQQTEVAELKVTKVTEAIGYGEGSISYLARKEAVGDATMQLVEDLIDSPEILLPISKDKHGKPIEDDGCGDGRLVSRIFKGLKVVARESLHRAKVFGGGLTMGLASRIGIGDMVAENLNDEYQQTIALFEEQGIGYGAHTDNHAHGENCGCGAIDKAPKIISNAVKFEAKIRGTVDALGIGDDYLDDIFANYRAASQRFAGKEYAGTKVIDGAKRHGKVVKELDADHLEAFILLNYVEGHTVNQQLVRQKTDNQVQVFAVDVWRMRQIAEKMYPDDLQKQGQAFVSQLVYMLATAATLTPGDLPVRAIEQTEYEFAV